jgi:hypothetical protein
LASRQDSPMSPMRQARPAKAPRPPPTSMPCSSSSRRRQAASSTPSGRPTVVSCGRRWPSWASSSRPRPSSPSCSSAPSRRGGRSARRAPRRGRAPARRQPVQHRDRRGVVVGAAALGVEVAEQQRHVEVPRLHRRPASADALDGPVGEGHRGEAGRHGQALLRARVRRVDVPVVDADVDAAEARDGVDGEERVGVRERRADLGDGLVDPGGGLGVDDRGEPRSVLLDGREEHLGLDDPPQGASTVRTSAPARRATSARRPPKTPLTPTTTRSPGSTRLTTTASRPALPVPDTGNVTRLRVRKTCRSRSAMSSSSGVKSGSRWPSSGSAMRARTAWWTSLGPGPMRMRSGGNMR